MAEDTTQGMISAPIVPALPQIETSRDPFALLHTPPPVVTPLIPSGIPQNLLTNIQLQGDSNRGPKPPGASDTQNGTVDFVKAIAEQMSDPNIVRDRNKYGKTYSYGAGVKNKNFERYYNHGKFKDLGFSAYRDNESYYNERGSWWDDFNRMRGQWGGLAAAGFKSVWGSEVEANQDMERGMAIGQSSKGGFGGWVTNFGLNTAYTSGIMAEMALENLALAGVTAATFGTAAPETIAVGAVRNSMLFGKLGRAWSGTYDFIKGLKSAEAAKEFYTAAKLGQKAKDFGNFVNPLERTMKFGKDMYNGTGGVKSLDPLAKMSRGFGDFYKDIRELNLAHSEARLEGEGAASRYEEKLIDEYYAEHGKMAEGEAAEAIHQRAQAVKGTVTLANDLTIYFSNKLVFENLLDGFRPGAKAAKGFLEGSGRFLKRTAAKDMKVGVTAIEAGTKTGGQKVKDFLLKSEYVPWSRKYMVGNISEGLQESAQEAITIGSTAYYDKIHKDPMQAGFYSQLASIGKGMGEQFSGHGLETFLSGYLMGSVIQGAQAGVMKTFDGAKSKVMGSQSEAAKGKEQAEKTDNDILNAANHVAENALIYGDHNINMATAMKLANQEKKKAQDRGDEKTAHDMSDELNITYLQNLARTGNMGLVTGHVDDMLTLDDKSLSEAYGLPEDQAGDVRKKLTTLKDRAEGYQKKFEYAKMKMPNPANPWMFDQKKHPEAYKAELQKYMAHENAVGDLLFATEDYERIGERMTSIGNNLAGRGSVLQNLVNVVKGGTPVANAAGSDVSLLIDHSQRMLTMQSLKEQISVLRLGNNQQKKDASDFQAQLDLLTKWNQMTDYFSGELASDAKAQVSPAEAEQRKQNRRVRPGAQVTHKKTGMPYTVERVEGDRAIVKNSKGELKSIKRSSLATMKDAKGLGKPLELEELEGDDLSHSISNMYDTFDEYIRHIAKMKKGHVFNDQLNQAFSQIKDYYALEHDSGRMVSTINKLSDPDYFQRYVDIEAANQKLRDQQKLKDLEAAMEAYRKMTETNDFLKELFDLGVFVLPEDVEKLKDFTMVDFYDTASKQIVPYNSEKYKQIQDIVDKYAQKAGQTTMGKAIPEQKRESEYNTIARSKLMNDNRTYADYAKQFGFDPNSATSTVPTEQVLKAIIDSKYATAAEKALSRRMLSTVAPGRVITFANNLATPGVYKSTTNETVIDARYASIDYGSGHGHPIEFVILHEYGHELTVEGLNTDPEFRGAIERLTALTQAYQLSPEGKALFGNKPLYGTKNEAEFVTEALANPAFQAMLQKIPYAVTGKPSTAWDEFTNTLKKFFARLLGVQMGNTVLDEALYIITAKIDSGIVDKTAKKAAKVGPGTVTSSTLLSTTTPLALLKMHTPDLLNELIEAYKDESTSRTIEGDTALEAANGTIDEILAAEPFKQFVTETGTASEIIDAYNKKTGRTAQGPQPTSKKKTTPSRWAQGNKWLFSGSTATGDLIDTPVEVVRDEGEHFDSDEKKTVHEILLRNLNTGEQFLIDLSHPDAVDFSVKPLPASTVQVDVIPQDVYDKFIDNGEVDPIILESIALKIKNHSPLSPYETAIFTGKTTEVNALIVEQAVETPREHKGVLVVEDLNIKASTGEPGAAQFDKSNKVIRINPVLMRQKYDEKAWTKSRVQKDGSKSTPLPADIFTSYEEFESFVIEHEYQHSVLDRGKFLAGNPGSKIGAYEDEINRRALTELGLLKTEVVSEEDVMELYNDITSKEDLNKWKELALDVIGNRVLRDKLSAEIGVEFNGDYVKNLIAEKEKGLAMSLTFEDLTPGTVVLMTDGRTVKVVFDRDDNNVTLVSKQGYLNNDPTAGKSIIHKSEIKNKIKMKHSEFIDKAEQEVPLTPEEVTDSDQAVKNAVADDANTISEDTEKAKNLTNDEASKGFFDSLNSCNT